LGKKHPWALGKPSHEVKNREWKDEERRRIARELHDGAGQLLAALGMEASNLASEGERLSARAACAVVASLWEVDDVVSTCYCLSALAARGLEWSALHRDGKCLWLKEVYRQLLIRFEGCALGLLTGSGDLLRG